MLTPQYIDVAQGSDEWLELRKTRITATDANTILGLNPWKTRLQLYKEKKGLIPPQASNARMQRGTELEPVARELFKLTTGWDMHPAVVVCGEMVMASLDGITPSGDYILEIKCPSIKIHETAKEGRVPPYYYPQLQHQLMVTGAKKVFYYSFDGFDGVTVEVERDDKYIAEMLKEEEKFFECLLSDTPPEPEDGDYVERHDDAWIIAALAWLEVNEKIKQLQAEEESLREELVSISNDNNNKGGGIAMAKVQRKGAVNYGIIPELKGVDLEPYRKASSSSWRILRK